MILREFTHRRPYLRFLGLWKQAGQSRLRQYPVISNTHIVHNQGETLVSAPGDRLNRRHGATRARNLLSESRIPVRGDWPGPPPRDYPIRFPGGADCRADRTAGDRRGASGEIRSSARTPPVPRCCTWGFAAHCSSGESAGCWTSRPWMEVGRGPRWTKTALPPPITGMGSRALTTAVVVEALAF